MIMKIFLEETEDGQAHKPYLWITKILLSWASVLYNFVYGICVPVLYDGDTPIFATTHIINSKNLYQHF